MNSPTKRNYCETLAHLVAAEKVGELSATLDVERVSIESEYRRKQTAIISSVLGINAAIGTMIVALTTVLDKPSASSPFKELIVITLPTVTILASVMVATAAMLVSVKLKKAREERNSDKET